MLFQDLLKREVQESEKAKDQARDILRMISKSEVDALELPPNRIADTKSDTVSGDANEFFDEALRRAKSAVRGNPNS